jgi:hypothetical protein
MSPKKPTPFIDNKSKNSYVKLFSLLSSIRIQNLKIVQLEMAKIQDSEGRMEKLKTVILNIDSISNSFFWIIHFFNLFLVIRRTMNNTPPDTGIALEFEGKNQFSCRVSERKKLDRILKQIQKKFLLCPILHMDSSMDSVWKLHDYHRKSIDKSMKFTKSIKCQIIFFFSLENNCSWKYRMLPMKSILESIRKFRKGGGGEGGMLRMESIPEYI